MKTIEDVFDVLAESEELFTEFKAITEKEELEAFLKRLGCDASVDEFAEYVKSQSEGEIDDDDVAYVAGGAPMYGFRKEE